jgi:hypothetical protein
MSSARISNPLLFFAFFLINFNLSATTEAPVQATPAVQKENPFQWKVSGKLKTGDSFYGKNISLLNNVNCYDQTVYVRHTLDLNTDLAYLDLVSGRVSMRNKAIWGTSELIKTTAAPTKLTDAVGQFHSHYFPRYVFWMRELWVDFSLNEAFGCHTAATKHNFTLGAFPFQLGRGIALGDAYAVGADYLGFYTDDIVDQYACGAQLYGDIVPNRLSYDFYAAILSNQSYSLSKTGEKIMGQEYGRLTTPERGFGHINWVFAARLNVTALDNPQKGKLTFEPYCLYNGDPEQRVDFTADAHSTLGTLGFASEYVGEKFECGFDTAFNLGMQHVKGWDKNTIQLQNRNGTVIPVNSHVYINMDPTSTNANSLSSWDQYKLPYITNAVHMNAQDGALNDCDVVSGIGKVANGLVNNAVQNDANNGKSIGIAVTTKDRNPNNPDKATYSVTTNVKDVAAIPSPLERTVGDINTMVSEGELFNDTARFRNPYDNIYKGWMMVADASYYFCDHTLAVAVTAGYASGDEDPNHVLKDGDYEGFIGLQSLYNGKRVQSAYYLGGASKLQLPLSVPPSQLQPDRLAALTSGFTNLALLGGGVTWKPNNWKKAFSINPNIIAYWQPYPSNKFDITTESILASPARAFLGTEFNIFIRKELMKNLEIFGIGSVFLPGSYFEDIKGKPLNEAQWRILDRLDRTGYNGDPIPGIGNDLSYTINLGIEYKF